MLKFNIFIPHTFLDTFSSLFLGVCTNTDEVSQLNCICVSLTHHNITRVLKELQALISTKNEYFSICIGSYGYKNVINFRKYMTDISESVLFDLISDNAGNLVVTDLFINGELAQNKSIKVILYNSQEIVDCELLKCKDSSPEMHETFVDILNKSLIISQSICQSLQTNRTKEDEHETRFYNPIKWKGLRDKLIMSLVFVFGFWHRINQYLHSLKIPIFLKKGFCLTATGRQVIRRLRDASNIFQITSTGKINLKCGNLLSALFFDVASGIFLTWFLRNYLNVEEIFSSLFEKTNVKLSELEEVILWLMGVPAGLKLNRPLNTVLGRFFLYHIYLWKTYIVVIKPHLLFALATSVNFGIFGTSFLISLASDYFTLATMHIYFFYSYAARLYELKITGLIALWRLFRGKKWNPLRQRVDSYTYDVQQLFIGTLLFTIVVFLFPTVIVYYAVFTLLRLAVMLVQSLLSRTMDLISIFPLYVIILQLIRHNFVKGEIFFQVFSSSGDNIFMSMKAIPLGWSKVISLTLPESLSSSSLTFKEILYYVIRGKIIYPF